MIGDRWRYPDRSRAESVDVVQMLLDTLQVAAAVLGIVLWVEFIRALVVVAGIAVCKAVGHQEVDDLVAPIRRRHMQFQCTR